MRTTDLRKYLNVGICAEKNKKHFGALTGLGEFFSERETPDEGNEVAGNLGRITAGGLKQ